MTTNEKHKILIADDHPLIHKLYSNMLRNIGYEVLNAYDGLEAIMLCIEHQPSLIILDISMPKADGRDICERLKEFSETKHIKILILSGRDQEHDRRQALELGADEYISKPCEVSFLQHTVMKMLAK